MKSELKVKFLQFLLNKKKDASEGFTLIELLVVVIIIGVLAAVALPNLLGQVGKARETEAKSALGSLNRSQQGYYLEKQKFYNGTDVSGALGVDLGSKYYTIANSTSASTTATLATFTADAVNPANDGTRDFASGVQYNSGTFANVVCVAVSKDTAGAVTSAVAAMSGSTLACTAGDSIK